MSKSNSLTSTAGFLTVPSMKELFPPSTVRTDWGRQWRKTTKILTSPVKCAATSTSVNKSQCSSRCPTQPGSPSPHPTVLATSSLHIAGNNGQRERCHQSGNTHTDNCILITVTKPFAAVNPGLDLSASVLSEGSGKVWPDLPHQDSQASRRRGLIKAYLLLRRDELRGEMMRGRMSGESDLLGKHAEEDVKAGDLETKRSTLEEQSRRRSTLSDYISCDVFLVSCSVPLRMLENKVLPST